MLIACHSGFSGNGITWAISFLSNSTFFVHCLLFQWTNSLYLRFFFAYNNPWGRQWFRVSLLLCDHLETSSLYAAVQDFLGIDFISMVNTRSSFLVHSTIWGGDCAQFQDEELALHWKWPQSWHPYLCAYPVFPDTVTRAHLASRLLLMLFHSLCGHLFM